MSYSWIAINEEELKIKKDILINKENFNIPLDDFVVYSVEEKNIYVKESVIIEYAEQGKTIGDYYMPIIYEEYGVEPQNVNQISI
jgi:hypothetical protein